MISLYKLTPTILILLLTACSPALLDATYVGDSKTGSYTKIPPQWGTVIIRNDPAFAVRAIWEPGSTQSDLLTPGEKVTGVLVRRAPMTEQEGDLTTLSRSIAFGLDAALESKKARIIEPFSVVNLGDFFSERIVYEIDTPNGTIKIQQIHAVDSLKGQVYGVAVGCSVNCYEENRLEIDQIINRFEVSK